MLSHPRTLPTGFIQPCLPTKAPKPPSGALWLHEIKHDGFRVIARKDGERVKLYSRPGNDLTRRFPLIVEALARMEGSRLEAASARGLVLRLGELPLDRFALLNGDGERVGGVARTPLGLLQRCADFGQQVRAVLSGRQEQPLVLACLLDIGASAFEFGLELELVIAQMCVLALKRFDWVTFERFHRRVSKETDDRKYSTS
jgi:ATP dependent DNA ligase-like protein